MVPSPQPSLRATARQLDRAEYDVRPPLRRLVLPWFGCCALSWRSCQILGRVPRPHKTNGFLGTLALWGGGWLPPPLGVGAENLLLRGQAYTHWTSAGVTEPNRTGRFWRAGRRCPPSVRRPYSPSSLDPPAMLLAVVSLARRVYINTKGSRGYSRVRTLRPSACPINAATSRISCASEI